MADGGYVEKVGGVERIGVGNVLVPIVGSITVGVGGGVQIFVTTHVGSVGTIGIAVERARRSVEIVRKVG